jgi:hypothetical protein
MAQNVTSLNGADRQCRRPIEMSPLAQLEMSLSPFFVWAWVAADDGDCDEPHAEIDRMSAVP